MSAAKSFVDLLGSAGLPVTLTGFVFVAFEFVERVTSKEAKRALTDWIRGLDVSATATLPADAAELFRIVFGPRHFSFQCFWRSACFSVAAILLFVAIKIVSDPHVYTSFLENMASPFEAIEWMFVAWIRGGPAFRHRMAA